MRPKSGFAILILASCSPTETADDIDAAPAAQTTLACTPLYQLDVSHPPAVGYERWLYYYAPLTPPPDDRVASFTFCDRELLGVQPSVCPSNAVCTGSLPEAPACVRGGSTYEVLADGRGRIPCGFVTETRTSTGQVTSAAGNRWRSVVMTVE